MFVFADKNSYINIIAQKENNPEFNEVVIEKISDIHDLLEKIKKLGIEENIIVFLNDKGYRGDVTTVAAKIVTEYKLAL